MSTEESVLQRECWVYNKSDKDFDHKILELSEERVTIPAGGKIRRTRRDGIRIRGNFPGKNIETSIVCEPIKNETIVADAPARVYVCPLCDKEYPSKDDLKTHVSKECNGDSSTSTSTNKKPSRGAE